MVNDLATQYDGFVPDYMRGADKYNGETRMLYYALFPERMDGKRLLDVGCGDGIDLVEFRQRGANVDGLDASEEMVRAANKRLGVKHGFERVGCGLMEDIPYVDNTFDFVASKYAIQTSPDVPQALREMGRVLKPGGTLVYIAVHPLRQFIEKKRDGKDYFRQEIVESILFEGTVTAYEPSHTLDEYLNTDFLKHFRLKHFSEHTDFPGAEQVNGDSYPCFMMVKAEKLNGTGPEPFLL